jgi:prevent-host-death family protein
MAAYNILEARNNLSRLIASVESGAEVTITRRGKPVARIVPVGEESESELPLGSGARIAAWFAANPLSPANAKTTAELDAIIEENRGPVE